MNKFASLVGGAAVAAAALVGGGVALGVGSGTGHHETIAAVSPTTVPGADAPGRNGHDLLDRALDALVAKGTLTQAQADAVRAQVKAEHDAMGDGAHGFGGRRGPFGAIGREGLDVVAKAIGITPEQLRTELGSGKSIAAVAAAHGVSETTVIDAVVAAAKTRLDSAVSAGRLTADQAAKIEAKLADGVKAFVEGTFGGHGPGGFGPGGFGPGRRGHHGPDADDSGSAPTTPAPKTTTPPTTAAPSTAAPTTPAPATPPSQDSTSS